MTRRGVTQGGSGVGRGRRSSRSSVVEEGARRRGEDGADTARRQQQLEAEARSHGRGGMLDGVRKQSAAVAARLGEAAGLRGVATASWGHNTVGQGAAIALRGNDERAHTAKRRRAARPRCSGTRLLRWPGVAEQREGAMQLREGGDEGGGGSWGTLGGWQPFLLYGVRLGLPGLRSSSTSVSWTGHTTQITRQCLGAQGCGFFPRSDSGGAWGVCNVSPPRGRARLHLAAF
jgi:hypothetical protein